MLQYQLYHVTGQIVLFHIFSQMMVKFGAFLLCLSGPPHSTPSLPPAHPHFRGGRRWSEEVAGGPSVTARVD